MASKKENENVLREGRTTSTPGGNRNFERFPNNSEGLSTFIENLPEDSGSASEHTMSDTSYDTQDTQNTHMTRVTKEVSVRRKERNTRAKDIQTSLTGTLA